MAPRKASTAVAQSLARRARMPRLYSLSALGVTVGGRTWSAAGELGSASPAEGTSSETTTAKPSATSREIIALDSVLGMPLAYRAGPGRSSGRWAAPGQECLDDDDVDAVLEEPELLELLHQLERRRRQTVERVERCFPIRVEARVFVAHDADPVAIVRDWMLREVERPAVDAADDLVHVRVGHLVGLEADLERGHLGVGTLTERTDEEPDVVRCDQRFVTLDIHVDVGGARLRDLPDPISPRRVLGGRHDRGDAERRARADDLLGIGRHQQVGEIRRPPGRFVHVDDEGLAGDLAEDLAGQAGGPKTGRNDAEDSELGSVAHGKARKVRSCASRAPSAMRSRQNAGGPTTPRPSRNRGDTCFTAPARSPARQAAFTASTSSPKPALRKK